MGITITKTNDCYGCRHIDHSGSFTPGGAKRICGHPDATELVTEAKGLHKLSQADFRKINSQDQAQQEEGNRIFKNSGAYWKNRQLPRAGWEIPAWCPLKHGRGY